ncbi:UDP-N-acetylmuramate dehydrogenase [Ruficoccus sp. ZRK36]|uniref:UDP-N-acetylmuramate dehydrogenase n=1 Tax=Ruficoccus sp. ZRK36 TaxID=2866311 RepID=UPI001C738F37|nr:UDP-N-acetylmuramate dehydrogenase [Ruficoccus sp. ZRK36]QYY35775.1 UDP-N-acetylmuramate dehydrogenase [Ruficoccus sp. ZRK36]
MMTAPEQPHTALPEEVFLLGIGGMGMAPLAICLAQAGCRVRGWDDNLKAPVRELLEAHGIEISNTPAPGSKPLIVRSSAVDLAHPLLAQSVAEGKATCLRRGELLARLAAGKKLVAIAGSHGKTTTTGMLIDMLRSVGFDFSYVLGGLFNGGGTLSPAHYSASSPWLVAEVDESDGTIEGFDPAVTVVVNLDWDHADRYRTEADLRAAFARLFARTSERVLLPEAFPFDEEIKAEVIRFEAPGINFNLDNANAALQACRLIAGTVPENPLSSFPGICRRQDVIHREGTLQVIADYAHHPTEIRALLSMMRCESEGPVWVVFQPHRYSRTRQFARDFAQVLDTADRAWVLPVYAASEPLDQGGTEERIFQEAGSAKLEAVAPGDLNGVLDRAMAEEMPGTLLFVGAGDIDRMAARFVRDRQLSLRWKEGLSTEAVIRLGEPLDRKTTIRIGGPARFYAEPADEADMAYLLREAREVGLPVLPLGRGSNLLVPDEGFDGLALGFKQAAWQRLELDGEERILAGAGVRLKQLCSFAAKHGLGGFEFLEGIPGTVGGSLRMNAGAMGGWIFDVVEEVIFVDAAGTVQVWPRERFHFGYRKCCEIADGLALGAVFSSQKTEPDTAIRARMDSYASTRKESQPREPSAGCIFKNPEGGHAGKIIDELGLKGLREGAAEVSSVHANFIINTGGATSADVVGLIRRIRETARRERGVELEPEVLLAGQKWEELL